MNDTQKMFQAIINGQSTFRQEVLSKIDKLDQKLGGRMDGLEVKIDQVEKNLTKRIDRLGKQFSLKPQFCYVLIHFVPVDRAVYNVI